MCGRMRRTRPDARSGRRACRTFGKQHEEAASTSEVGSGDDELRFTISVSFDIPRETIHEPVEALVVDGEGPKTRSACWRHAPADHRGRPQEHLVYARDAVERHLGDVSDTDHQRKLALLYVDVDVP